MTFIPPDRVLINPAWLDPLVLAGMSAITVDPDEPAAANTLTLSGVTLVSSAYPRTADKLEAAGIRIRRIEVTELQVTELHKAEAALTCLSLIV